MRQLKGQCAALQKAVERLQYESELKELRNNPVGEELGGDEAFEQIEQLQKQTHAKDRELDKLKRELERMQTSIVDEDDDLDQMSGGGGLRGSGLGGGIGMGGGDDDYSSVPGGGEATYGQQLMRRAEAEESRRADGNAAHTAVAEAEAAAFAAKHGALCARCSARDGGDAVTQIFRALAERLVKNGFDPDGTKRRGSQGGVKLGGRASAAKAKKGGCC